MEVGIEMAYREGNKLYRWGGVDVGMGRDRDRGRERGRDRDRYGETRRGRVG